MRRASRLGTTACAPLLRQAASRFGPAPGSPALQTHHGFDMLDVRRPSLHSWGLSIACRRSSSAWYCLLATWQCAQAGRQHQRLGWLVASMAKPARCTRASLRAPASSVLSHRRRLMRVALHPSGSSQINLIPRSSASFRALSSVRASLFRLPCRHSLRAMPGGLSHQFRPHRFHGTFSSRSFSFSH